MNKSVPKLIKEAFSGLKPDPAWSFVDCTRAETAKWTHGYHRYPAKFIPQIVEKLFDEYLVLGENHVNDPFFGSGTTIVSGIARGYFASGTDINGIAYLMTKVKAHPIKPSYLERKIASFLRKIEPCPKFQSHLFDISEFFEIPKNHLERIDYWFNPENKRELGRILYHIQQESDQKIREFLLVAFSHILKSCSIWLQKSTKPTRDFNKTPVKPYDALRRHLKYMVRGNASYYQVVPQKTRENIERYLNIQMGDARQQPVEDNSVDIIVSSSPYVTSYEYADLHQLSTIWLDFTNDLKSYRSKFVGSLYRERKIRPLRSSIAQKIVTQMREKSPRLSRSIEIFFLDMEDVFLESYRILKEGGHCCFVIGDTRLKGVQIANSKVFAESLLQCGFQLERVIMREIPSKILPQTRDKETGRFISTNDATFIAYPTEYIIVGKKDG